MMKFLAAAAMVLVVAAANVGHAGSSTCFNDCMTTCERSGSLARDCQIECNQECPYSTPPPPVCTTIDNSAANSACTKGALAEYFACLGLIPYWGVGAAFCSSNYQKDLNACPPSSVTVCK